MKTLETLTMTELATWVQQAKIQANQGLVANRIPKLAVVDPHCFAVHIFCKSGQAYSTGDTKCVFPLMSAIKPFSLLYLLEHLGLETVFQWVGVQPSDAPFNSLTQLVRDQGFPRNPMINSGAITLADKLPGKDPLCRTQNLCQWLNQLAGCNFKLDEAMLASVRSVNSQTNQAIAQYLALSGYIDDVKTAIDTYEQICCLSGTVEDLACLGKILFLREIILPQNRRCVNALMLTCGLYEASGKYSIRIGLPMKSGISGALLTIVPTLGAIATYSPALDSVGNSVAGLAFIEALSEALTLSLL
ncbi:MAG: glutaminase A [Tolypothrix brevis GSE-NOS-MK-07-07A]|nr:glutaminase A [Tolypothrix brevis GSE-NOS-MK-07-07A]